MTEQAFEKILFMLMGGTPTIGRFLLVFMVLLLGSLLYMLLFKFEKIKEIILFFKDFPEKRKEKKIKKLIENRKDTEIRVQEQVFVRTIEQNEKISRILDRVLQDFSADRVYIFQYHNTGYFKTGLSQLKASNTFEICRVGVKQEKKYLQNIPISMFALWNYHIRDHKNMFYPEIRTMQKEDPGMYETLRTQDVKSVFNVGLYTEKGFPIGFFGIEYCTQGHDLNFERRMKLVEIGKDITGLLS